MSKKFLIAFAVANFVMNFNAFATDLSIESSNTFAVSHRALINSAILNKQRLVLTAGPVARSIDLLNSVELLKEIGIDPVALLQFATQNDKDQLIICSGGRTESLISDRVVYSAKTINEPTSIALSF